MPVVPLDPKVKEILFRFGEAILPRSRLFPAYTRQSVDRLEAFLSTANEQMLLAFPKVLWMIENGSYPRYLRPMSKLPSGQAAGISPTLGQGSAPAPNGFCACSPPWSRFPTMTTQTVSPLWASPTRKNSATNRRGGCRKSPPAQEMLENEEVEAEVIVVGTGAGGAAAAYELAKRGNAVVMIEAGEHHRRQSFNGRAWDMQRLMYYDYAGTYALRQRGPLPSPSGAVSAEPPRSTAGRAFALHTTFCVNGARTSAFPGAGKTIWTRILFKWNK